MALMAGCFVCADVVEVRRVACIYIYGFDCCVSILYVRMRVEVRRVACIWL